MAGVLCAKVIHAKLEGTGANIAFSPVTKKNVEFQSVSASGERCAIRNGNVRQRITPVIGTAA